jgi:hypothetical protein
VGVLGVKDVDGQPVVLLLLGQDPRLKRLAVGHGEAGQEVGA